MAYQLLYIPDGIYVHIPTKSKPWKGKTKQDAEYLLSHKIAERWLRQLKLQQFKQAHPNDWCIEWSHIEHEEYLDLEFEIVRVP
jgi:hypothetical protein